MEDMVFILQDLLLDQFRATMFLLAVAVLGVAIVLLIVLSFRAQKEYDTEELPSLEDDLDLEEEVEDIFDVEGNYTEPESVFALDDEPLDGDSEAADLFGELKAAETVAEKKPLKGKKDKRGKKAGRVKTPRKGGLFKKKSE